MEIIRYAILAVLFAFCGLACVQALVAPLARSRGWALAAGLALASGLLLLLTGFRDVQRWIVAGLGLVSLLGGYLWMTDQVMRWRESPALPALVRTPDDPGQGHTAVVYCTHGEPERYDPSGWINQFREFDEQKIRFIPRIARPFFLYNLRKKYQQVGRSEHRAMHQRMIRSLEQTFRDAGDGSTRFYLSFLDDKPHPDAATIQALNEGASRLVVAQIFLTDSNHTAEGKAQIAAILEKFPELPVHYAGPLHDAEPLKRMFVARANRYLGQADRTKTGVLLVGHGQPEEWDREWPTETEQEISFRLGVLEHFAAEGYLPLNMSLAWMEFRQPKPAQKIAEFVRNGVERILYFPAAISADSLHSQADIPELVERGRARVDVEMVNLGAWNDDPLVIQAIKQKIDAAMQRF